MPQMNPDLIRPPRQRARFQQRRMRREVADRTLDHLPLGRAIQAAVRLQDAQGRRDAAFGRRRAASPCVKVQANWDAISSGERAPEGSYHLQIQLTAPAIANAGKLSGCSVTRPKYIATTAPSPAQEVTPVTPGSASGLAKSPCKAAPLPAKAAPTTSASAARATGLTSPTCSGPMRPQRGK